MLTVVVGCNLSNRNRGNNWGQEWERFVGRGGDGRFGGRGGHGLMDDGGWGVGIGYGGIGLGDGDGEETI